ncbi:MAG: peptide-methionine (R)-S-oxide reductase MsrB [Verrucomicrobiales bacterium]|nr:peptide-methionine (R)-S-oxide reductase MsrB [Verrucomicrobiales bacterium]
MNHHFSTILVINCGLILSGCFPDAAKPPGPDSIETQDAPEIKKVVRSDEEWRSLLTPEQYHILRESGTERPNGETYAEFNSQGAGTYFCGGCDAELFSSKHKFNSHCGWPSFYDPANAKNVVTYEDNTLGVSRVEVRCAVCDGHLGHVFTGEGFDTPTDKRYCINGVALKFVPDE